MPTVHISIHRVADVPFNQDDLIEELNPREHERLLNYNSRFSGLCELICNRILMDETLGKGHDLSGRITPTRLNEEAVLNSHIVDVYSIFRKFLALLFGIYPDNVFSTFEQWNLLSSSQTGRVVNQDVLKCRFDALEDDETLKLLVFSTSITGLEGHSLLIKKTDERYVFFDPYFGEFRHLSFEKLCELIDEQINIYDANHLFITRGRDYLARL